MTLACVNVMIASDVPTLLHNTAAAAELLPSKIFTMPVFVNGTAINTAANGSVFTNTGIVNLLLGNNNAAGAVLCNNVGTGDAIITFTQANVTATSGAGVLSVRYIVKDSDGSANPSQA